MKTAILTHSLRLYVLCLCGLFYLPAWGQQSYPDRSIRMVLPFSAGGGTDVVGRIVAKGLSERLKQPVVVDNKAGGGSTIGTDIVAKSAPDGYTLLFASASHSFSPTVYKQLPYSQDDFIAIAVVNITPLMLTVHPSVGTKDLKSFIQVLKSQPEKFTYASSGVGTTLHIAAEMFVAAAGLKAVHVPYKGESPAMTDLLSGQVSFMVGQASTAVPYLKNGRLLGLGLTTPKRMSSIPEIPTLSEAGLPDFSAYGWNVILAPKGTPRATIDRLNKEINAVISSPEVLARFTDLGLDVLELSTPESAAQFVKNETLKWAPVIRAAGLKNE